LLTCKTLTFVIDLPTGMEYIIGIVNPLMSIPLICADITCQYD